MEVVNLTPHPIRIGKTTIAPTGTPIRIYQDTELLYTIGDIPVKLYKGGYSKEPLPPIQDNTIYIVSRLVADCYRDQREDFLFPYDFTRTQSGRIIGSKSLARF